MMLAVAVTFIGFSLLFLRAGLKHIHDINSAAPIGRGQPERDRGRPAGQRRYIPDKGKGLSGPVARSWQVQGNTSLVHRSFAMPRDGAITFGDPVGRVDARVVERR